MLCVDRANAVITVLIRICLYTANHFKKSTEIHVNVSVTSTDQDKSHAVNSAEIKSDFVYESIWRQLCWCYRVYKMITNTVSWISITFTFCVNGIVKGLTYK